MVAPYARRCPQARDSSVGFRDSQVERHTYILIRVEIRGVRRAARIPQFSCIMVECGGVRGVRLPERTDPAEKKLP